MKKNIRIHCYGPVALGNKYKSSWEDVWISYFSGKRRIVEEGPCIVGMSYLQSELEYESNDYHDEYVIGLLRIKDELLQGSEFALLDPSMASDIPEIYVRQRWVDHHIVEKAIKWYLTKKGILKSEPRFKWNKIKKCYGIFIRSWDW